MADLHPRHRRLRLAALALLLLPSACVPSVQGLGMREVELNLPGTFGDAAGAPTDLDALRAAEIFQDPKLTALIEEALVRNKELFILTQEINVDSAEIIARRGEVLPRLDLGVDAGVEKVGRYTSQGAADAGVEMSPGREVPEHLGDFRIELRAAWEIDVWKKLKSATQAARARYAASVEGRRFVITGLVAEITHAWYELCALDRQLEVIDRSLEIQRDALSAARLQLEAAQATALAVQRFEAELLKTSARRVELVQQRVQTESHLNALVGRYPQPVARSPERLLDLPLASMAAGLPAELLERRPDIRAAELDLEAAKLDVKVARARFFPSLSIDARFGIEAFNPAKFAALPASLLYEAAAQLLAPLLNRAEIKAGYVAANAEQMQAVAAYEQTVLLAFVDVANQVAAVTNTDETFSLKARQAAVLESAIDTSNQLFRAARADFLEVLTTRSEALEAQLELVEARQRQIAARVDLYRALGGGWPEPADAAVTSTHPAHPGR